MIEAMFYIIWKGSITARWRTLNERMAKIAWNQRHSELSSVSDGDCKNACEKLVMEPDIKFAPSLGAIINRIIREGDERLQRGNNQAFKEDENFEIASPGFKDEMVAACIVIAGGNDERKLMTIDMIPSVCEKHGCPLSGEARAKYNALKLQIQSRMVREAPIRKAEQAHKKKLTHAEKIALARKPREEKGTLGNALGRALK